MNSSNKARHEEFLAEIRSPLKTKTETKESKLKITPIEDDSSLVEEEIQKALAAKFDELFGPLGNNDDNNEE
ncbi:MAG: hypothetical protein IKL00_10770 [Oscillospiraceae bacterium]|nr:hypothetical protein [Oscillospiraceae bacterium]